MRAAVPASPPVVRLAAAAAEPLVPVDRWTPPYGRFPAAVIGRWSVPGPFAGLGAACKAAVERWFGRHLLQVAQAALRAVGRWTAVLPRPASGDGALVLPKMRRRLWVRLTRLQMHRSLNRYGQARPGRVSRKLADLQPGEVDQLVGEIAVGDWERGFTKVGVQRMVGFLSDIAEADGQLVNIGLLIAGYASHFGCDERQAYRDWEAIWKLGLVRNTVRSAYKRKARYVLTFPPARIPSDLPEDGHPHASLISVRDLPGLASATQVWDETAAALVDELGDAELVRYGSARCEEPVTVPDRPTGNDHAPTLLQYWCQAFPYIARGEKTPPRNDPARGPEPRQRPSFRGGITEDERAAALSVLAGCRRRWTQQGLTPPNVDELAVISGLTAVALRYTTPGDLTALLTERSASARHVLALARWRLQRCINDHRRRREVPADEDGTLYAVKDQARAAEAVQLHQATSGIRAKARAAMEAARARKAASEAQGGKRRPLAAPTAGEWPAAPVLTEPEETLAADLAARGLTTNSAPTTAELAALRQATANAWAVQHRRQPPPAAQILGRSGWAVDG